MNLRCLNNSHTSQIANSITFVAPHRNRATVYLIDTIFVLHEFNMKNRYCRSQLQCLGKGHLAGESHMNVAMGVRSSQGSNTFSLNCDLNCCCIAKCTSSYVYCIADITSSNFYLIACHRFINVDNTGIMTLKKHIILSDTEN